MSNAVKDSKENGAKPAFVFVEGGLIFKDAFGLTKREEFARSALQGLCSSESGFAREAKDLVTRARLLADLMLLELEQNPA